LEKMVDGEDGGGGERHSLVGKGGGGGGGPHVVPGCKLYDIALDMKKNRHAPITRGPAVNFPL
jgi:hypothetical protein